MTMAVGTEVYNADSAAVVARGRSLADAELDAALDGAVRRIVENSEGTNRIRDALAHIIHAYPMKRPARA